MTEPFLPPPAIPGHILRALAYDSTLVTDVLHNVEHTARAHIEYAATTPPHCLAIVGPLPDAYHAVMAANARDVQKLPSLYGGPSVIVYTGQRLEFGGDKLRLPGSWSILVATPASTKKAE